MYITISPGIQSPELFYNNHRFQNTFKVKQTPYSKLFKKSRLTQLPLKKLEDSLTFLQ